MILVDTPRWTWRNQTWGHLVSDASLEELHDFARQLGKRRIGFQGDHYDVSRVEHARALQAGAVGVDSRELMRRLRKAGLRDRSKKPSWKVTYQSDHDHSMAEVAQIVSTSITERSIQERFTETLKSAPPLTEAHGVLMVERPNLAALVLEFGEVLHLDPAHIDLLNRTYDRERHVVELIIGEE